MDITLLLETIKAEDLQVGAWLNVIGYVRQDEDEERQRQRHRKDQTTSSSSSSSSAIYVEAVMIFSAGAVNIGEYERILRDAQEVDRRVRRP